MLRALASVVVWALIYATPEIVAVFAALGVLRTLEAVL